MRQVLHGPCREFGCSRRPAYIESGYCLVHHKTRHERGSKPRPLYLLGVAFIGPCREPPCTHKVSGEHGYCARHQRLRLALGHFPHRVSSVVGPKCRLPSCARSFADGRGGGYGLCGAHYRRLNRLYSDPERRRWAADMSDTELEVLLERKDTA